MTLIIATDMGEPDESTPQSERPSPSAEPVSPAHPDDAVIEAHLRLTPSERLQALQAFVEDILRMRDGRRPAVR